LSSIFQTQPSGGFPTEWVDPQQAIRSSLTGQSGCLQTEQMCSGNDFFLIARMSGEIAQGALPLRSGSFVGTTLSFTSNLFGCFWMLCCQDRGTCCDYFSTSSSRRNVNTINLLSCHFPLSLVPEVWVEPTLLMQSLDLAF